VRLRAVIGGDEVVSMGLTASHHRQDDRPALAACERQYSATVLRF
jgi:hypothetical protein